MTWAEVALARLKAGEAVALISILAVEGSTPREAGTRMVVWADGEAGSIGGGNLEYQAIAQARAALDNAEGTWRIQDYPLGPLIGQCCGGRVRLMVEHLQADAADWLVGVEGGRLLETRLLEGGVERQVCALESVPPHPNPLPQGRGGNYIALSLEGEGGLKGRVRGDALSAKGDKPSVGDVLLESLGSALTSLLVFGNGHVGQALLHVLKGLPFRVRVMDTRDGDREDDMLAAAENEAGLLLIMTHDHALDYRLLEAALCGQARFIGLIGSATKRARFLSRLEKAGFDDAQRGRVNCPIGVPGIVGKAPEVIAVSVVAQLLTLTTNLTAQRPPSVICFAATARAAPLPHK